MLGQMPRWRLFKISGHEVFLEPWFLLLVGFFVFGNLTSATQLAGNLLWAPILFVGILWHEIGHALAIKRLGYGPSIIILQGLGGVTINERRSNANPKHSIVISLAGPIFSVSLTVVFGVLWALLPDLGLLTEFFSLMAQVNLVWAIFNMLPIAPLDGGHVVLHALHWWKKNYRKALEWSAYSSLVILAILAVPLTMLLSPMWTILLFLLFGMHNVRVIQALKQGARIR